MELLSAEHVAMLAATLVLCVAAGAIPRRNPSASWPFVAARCLAVLLIANEIAIRVVLLADGDWDWGTDRTS